MVRPLPAPRSLKRRLGGCWSRRWFDAKGLAPGVEQIQSMGGLLDQSVQARFLIEREDWLVPVPLAYIVDHHLAVIVQHACPFGRELNPDRLELTKQPDESLVLTCPVAGPQHSLEGHDVLGGDPARFFKACFSLSRIPV